jgi:hypothetical protein
MEEVPPSEASSHLFIQDIPCLLWNLKIHYHVHNSLDPVLSQMNLVHALLPCICFNISLPPMSRQTDILYTFLISHACNKPWPCHPLIKTKYTGKICMVLLKFSMRTWRYFNLILYIYVTNAHIQYLYIHMNYSKPIWSRIYPHRRIVFASNNPTQNKKLWRNQNFVMVCHLIYLIFKWNI